MDDLGAPLFQETSICSYVIFNYFIFIVEFEHLTIRSDIIQGCPSDKSVQTLQIYFRTIYTHMLHVWKIYLHLDSVWGKCR